MISVKDVIRGAGRCRPDERMIQDLIGRGDNIMEDLWAFILDVLTGAQQVVPQFLWALRLCGRVVCCVFVRRPPRWGLIFVESHLRDLEGIFSSVVEN